MKRALISALKNWRNKPKRKPLLLMGVRQVGKTYLLQAFGQSAFSNVHYLNFESDREIKSAFDKSLDPARLVREIEFYLGQSINLDTDLLILDEIQACPLALTSLKYFNEKMPKLAVTAAGSLLGLHLNETSFPVGQVDMLHLSPLSFKEFLAGTDQQQLLDLLNQHDFKTALPESAHSRLWDAWKCYLITGGLPEVVQEFADRQESMFDAFHHVRLKQKELIKAYYADIAKHSGKTNAMHITRVWEQVGVQLSTTHDGNATRFKFKDLLPGVDRYQRLANVIDWLVSAHLVIKVPLVNNAGLPLKAYTKESFFKLFYFDVGILGAIMDLSPTEIWQYDYGSYKGYFAENFVAQALQSSSNAEVYSWQEGKHEVEFLKQVDGAALPIEVKSGTVTRAKSLQKFIEKYAPPSAIVLSGKNIAFNDDGIQKHFPIYLADELP